MWILENETSTAFEARLFSFMDSGFAFVDLCTQVGGASFQVLLVVPTIGEGPHILLDSLRILPGNFVFAMGPRRVRSASGGARPGPATVFH